MKPLIVPFFISHLGCPHQCVFCDQTRIAGKGRLPAAIDLLDRIAAYRATSGGAPLEIAFYGGTFTTLPAAAMEQLLIPLQPLVATGEIVSIRVSTRPDAVDKGITEFLVGMGVTTVELGVQSMDDGVLAHAGRGHNAAHTVHACRTLQAQGVTVGMQLMPGLPGDSETKTLASLDACLALHPDFLRIYPTLVIAGTRLADLFATGAYKPLPLARALHICKIILHRALTAGTKVIRIGLQPTRELEAEGTVLAGPYHPAFRQLVEADLCYDLLRKLAGDIPAGASVTVGCAPTRLSDVVGQKRGNLRRLAAELGVRLGGVAVDPALSPLEVTMTYGWLKKKGHIVHDLDYRDEVIAIDQ